MTTNANNDDRQAAKSATIQNDRKKIIHKSPQYIL